MWSTTFLTLTAMVLQSPLMLLLLPGLLVVSDAQAATMGLSQFKRCPKGQTLSSAGGQLMSVTSRSALECLTLCSKTTLCRSVDVCATGPRSVSCRLMVDGENSACGGLTPGSPDCFFAEKVYPAVVTTTTTTTTTTTPTPTTTPIACANGGTSNGTHCKCTIQYSGPTCSRYIRDCSEPVQNGYDGSQFNGVYFIQPVGVTAPFKVYCLLQWGGNTKPFNRRVESFGPTTWDQAKNGFGADIATAADPENAVSFKGLEKLHQITRQGNYNNHVFFMYNTWTRSGNAYYDNFSIGAESTSYEFLYTSFFDGANVGNPADNGLVATTPLRFSTPDQSGGCAAQRGAAGWYTTTGCQGYSVFADNPVWPVDGTAQAVDIFAFNLVRRDPFWVDVEAP